MELFSRKRLVIAGIIVCCVAALGAAMFVFFSRPKTKKIPTPTPTITAPQQPAAAPKKPKVEFPTVKTIGYSIQSRPIEIFSFGNETTRLVFVFGIHGGYEWNTTLLAYELIDYFKKYPKKIPENLAIDIIPTLNPDGLFKITGKSGRFEASDIPAGATESGRLNANSVDLNRNFDCNWQATGTWRQKPVSGGDAPFSEPETAALKKFILETNPAAAVFWHSQSNAVYGSMCGGAMPAQTRDLMDIYSQASGYPAKDTFDQYSVTGDASDWLASINIPSISIELKTHQASEFEKNLAGINALSDYYQAK